MSEVEYDASTTRRQVNVTIIMFTHFLNYYLLL